MMLLQAEEKIAQETDLQYFQYYFLQVLFLLIKKVWAKGYALLFFFLLRATRESRVCKTEKAPCLTA